MLIRTAREGSSVAGAPRPLLAGFVSGNARVAAGFACSANLAARAGIPQLVLPQASDQYQWADRVLKTGLGPRGVDMNRMKPHKLSTAIAQLVQREDFAVNARALGDRVRGIDGPRNAVALFERIKGGLEARRPLGVGAR